MYTSHNPCWDAKNRHGLADELPFDYQEIAHCIPDTAPAPEHTPKTKKKNPEPPKEPPKPERRPEDTATTTETDLDPKIPKALVDLMAANNVTAQDIQQAVAHKGYFPADMPIADYPEDFVMGCLVGAFPQMLQVIQDLKKVPF